jgi:hypothetical protein
LLRVKSETGWWLITHRDHAHLAAAIAAHWGNDTFLSPEPRSSVLKGICVHDDGWVDRDAQPCITREGKPSAFSQELVGKYSAFEEIDLADYLAVRTRALIQIEAENAYAALLVSMHTYNLLTERADRRTIALDQLPLLDAFLQQQLEHQDALIRSIRANSKFIATDCDEETILNNFRLLQATDNLSLYGCVGCSNAGTLIHPMPTIGGVSVLVEVFPIAARHFRLKPYPLDEPMLTFAVPARHVEGSTFASSAEFAELFHSAPQQHLNITISI